MEFEDLYRDIVERSEDGYWVFDLSGRTIYVNPAMASMYGAARQEFAELTVRDTLDEEGRAQFERHLADLRAGRYTDPDVECLFVRKDGSQQWVLVSETLLRGPDGEVTAVVHRMSDYQQRRQLLDELTASREALAEAQRIARIGSWTWDLPTGQMTASDSLFELYDARHLSNPVEPREFFDRVHPDDLPIMEQAIARTVEYGEDLSLVVRVRAGDDWVWVRARGVGHRDAAGRVVTMTGTHQDISETRQVERALEDQVAQNLLMQAIASAANEARTLNDVLARARSLILLHDDWRRGRAFVPRADGSGVDQLHLFEQDALDDEATPEETRHELELANTCYHAQDLVWDEERLTIAFPVVHAGTVHAVLTITSDPPLYRFELIESNARQCAVQLGRVVERELAERELARARDAAMEASRQKSEFLARMSHEIRTPLNGVIGLNELLLRTPLDAEQQRLASGVRTAGGTLLALINDILDFSKIEAGMLQLEYVRFDPGDVLDQAVDVLRESAHSKHLAIDVRHDALPEVVGDPTRLGQVLLNLGSNAIKFTSEGHVSFEADADEVDGRVRLHVQVSDTGIGLAGVDVVKLFESFAQGDASTTRVHGGTGLGLAISREIVEALGGEIGARPRPGGGSVFWFTALLDRSADPAGAAPRGRTGAGVPDAVVPRIAGRAPRILVVEDNEVNQMVAVGLLESLGCETSTASDGAAALDAVRGTDYDLVLMDVQMPRLDGYATTRELRRIEAETGRARVPIVAMTASAIEGEQARALAAGMDDFLTKPVDPRRLARVLASRLGTGAAEAPGPDGPGEPAAPEPDRVLDLERLDMLRDMAEGDTSYLDRVIGRFADSTADAVEGLRTAVAEDDAVALRARAHKLAGGALNLGAREVGVLARELEHLADEGTTTGAERLLARLEEAIAAARAALLDYQRRYRTDGR